jgi:ElaB/YqjD/DUF883 family membrane-anchored ribosome-binding protein
MENHMPRASDAYPTTDPTHEAVDELKGRAHEQVDRVGDQAELAAKFAENAAREMNDYARRLRPALERSIKDQPMMTLAGAVAVGLLLGALWRR